MAADALRHCIAHEKYRDRYILPSLSHSWLLREQRHHGGYRIASVDMRSSCWQGWSNISGYALSFALRALTGQRKSCCLPHCDVAHAQFVLTEIEEHIRLRPLFRTYGSFETIWRILHCGITFLRQKSHAFSFTPIYPTVTMDLRSWYLLINLWIGYFNYLKIII